MKKFWILLACVSCQMLGVPDVASDQGELRVSFMDDCPTRVQEDVPDTSDFLLTISGPDGEVIYDGPYGASPESMMVDAGSYTVFARSSDFAKPAFASPQYGDEQVVVVPSGGVADVKLTCVQLNAGIRLKIDKSFLDNCPNAALFLKSSAGKLMYSYTEKRIAYFSPGTVSLMMSDDGADKILLSRELQARTVLELSVSASGKSHNPSEESVTIAIDTSRVWNQESYVIGGSGSSSGKGHSVSDAFTVSQALASLGEEDVWVCGYIVGGDLTSSSASFDVPFTSRTNLLLGPRSSTSSRSSCIAVSLPSGSVRDDVNLVDNQNLLGRKICIKGDLVEAYYGMPGLKNVTDYELM
ncbi:MAG: DUF4493 domain-containing protein [Bacteroidales bacterium]|nr:DUF4493 domain-containing protein [Bacteroidales bacterium]